MLNCIYFIKRFKKNTLRDMASNGFTNSLFTVTYRIIQTTVIFHSRDDYRKEELNLQKSCFFMF